MDTNNFLIIALAALSDKCYDKQAVVDTVVRYGDEVVRDIAEKLECIYQDIDRNAEAIERLKSFDSDITSVDEATVMQIVEAGGVENLINDLHNEIRNLYIRRFNFLRIILFISLNQTYNRSFDVKKFIETIERADSYFSLDGEEQSN